jgi:hypothetical protein
VIVEKGRLQCRHLCNILLTFGMVLDNMLTRLYRRNLNEERLVGLLDCFYIKINVDGCQIKKVRTEKIENADRGVCGSVTPLGPGGRIAKTHVFFGCRESTSKYSS